MAYRGVPGRRARPPSAENVAELTLLTGEVIRLVADFPLPRGALVDLVYLMVESYTLGSGLPIGGKRDEEIEEEGRLMRAVVLALLKVSGEGAARFRSAFPDVAAFEQAMHERIADGGL